MGMKIMNSEKSRKVIEDMKKSELLNLTFFITESGYVAQIECEDTLTMLLNECSNRDEIKEKISLSSALFLKEIEKIVSEVISQVGMAVKEDIENRMKSVS